MTTDADHPQQYYPDLVENANDIMFVLDLSGRFLTINRTAEELIGYRRKEARHMSIADVVVPEDLERVQQEMCKKLEGQVASVYRASVRTRDGRVLPLELSTRLIVRDGWPVAIQGVGRDIGDRLRMEQELTDQLALLRTVFETAPVGISLTDAEGRHLRNNARRCELLGYSEEELTRLKFEDFTHPDDLEQEIPLYHEMAAGKRDQYALDKRYIRKDGSLIWVHLKTEAVRAEDGTLRFIVAMIEDITERKGAEASLRQLAQYDAVTGLPNRRLLDDRIDQALALASRRGEVLALLFVDLDGFKAVNDTYGHDCGDRLLRSVGEILAAGVRGSDTVARWAGDEFAILLPDVGSARNAERTARKLLNRINGVTMVDDRSVTISASVGVGLYPFNGTTAAALLEAADGAMYLAKQRGKGQVAVAMSQR